MNLFRIPVFISDAVKQLHKVQVRAEEASTLQEMVETLNAQKSKFAEEIRSVKDNEARVRAQMEDMEQDNNRLESQCMELKRYTTSRSRATPRSRSSFRFSWPSISKLNLNFVKTQGKYLINFYKILA